MDSAARRKVDGEKARALLAAGRHAEALSALRGARRRWPRGEARHLALLETDALFGALRYREAVGVTTRALRRAPGDQDLAARLRIARGHALWVSGRVGPGRLELQKALEAARAPLTRARAHEHLGHDAWRSQDAEVAQAHLASARELYEAAGLLGGLLRVLEHEAGILRDTGRSEPALAVHDRRIEAASAAGRTDLLAAARNDRGDLLAALGRWGQAREELSQAAALFRQIGDPREATLVGVNRAAVDLAAGDLAGAQAALDRALGVLGPDASDPRALGEVHLLVSDLRLVAREHESAERAAVEALGAFGRARDRQGECRSRVRRSHALVGLGRVDEARREAHRALRFAPRRDLEALAGLALGRALLRGRGADASLAFDRMLAVCDGRTELALAARLGRALAAGAAREDEAVRLALAGLEMWGDRRLLALCQADLGEIAGPARMDPGPPADPEPAGGRDPDSLPLVDAALALAAEGDWCEGWARAMRALRPVLPWHRVAFVCEDGWELRGEESPRPLTKDDFARELAAAVAGAAVVDLGRDPRWREHPARVLHRLGSALVAPAGPGGFVYLDRRDDGPSLGESDLRLAIQVGRLVGSRPPQPRPEDRPPQRFPEIVGRCQAMEELFGEMARVAASSLPVHVYGETGTGKEKVAEALHRRSRRADRPFLALNASSLSDDLFESEMFGHARGAFTGAVAARNGHVAEADGGTLFIDEVADLSLRGQAKLLRFLENGEYRRLGESSTRRADVRILSAANVRLASRVAEGRFREDLMYRVAPVTLALPPLRDRGDDVLLLARHFLREAAARDALAIPALTPDLGRALLSHAWPGNVRELQNEMKRLVLVAGREPVRREHLSQRVLGRGEPVVSALRDALAACERAHIRDALERNGGNRARTAHALGVTRQGLLAKMRRLGM